jgi:hypothetical protein
LHWVDPVVHALQLPAVHVLEHTAPLFCHVPLLLQVCGCKPLHCIDPGVQTPVQMPPAQTYVHRLALLCQVPLALQVCGCRPLHWTDAGEQTPMQPPALQA